jgi:hypothetical protein
MHDDARWIVRIGVLLVLLLGAGEIQAQDKAPAPPLAADRLAAIDRISGDSLKGHLSFLSSDLLEGRDTPSRGLDLAAEYIAAQFRRAGLEPVGDDGYFQTANWELSEPDISGFKFEVVSDGKTISIDPSSVLLETESALDIKAAPIYKLDLKAADIDFDSLQGKIVFIESQRTEGRVANDPAAAQVTKNLEIFRETESPPALLITIGRPEGLALRVNDPRHRRLIDPSNFRRGQPVPKQPALRRLSVTEPNLVALYQTLPVGLSSSTATIRLNPTVKRPVKLKNVAGLLRGSDPVLKDTCVMVTAHYDHIGVKGAEGTDRIFNGANDDGSGTVSVIELATSLATLKERPKRSILFVTFFGEEKGLLGSRYYGRNPIFPVDKTVADVNLEQVGRTDDSEGPQLLKASLTGFGYSGVSTAFVNAGEAEGVKVVKHPRNSDAFFGRSDNQALADLGVPAHTLCVAFMYPDYHGAADHWDKVDYANMARIDRMVARALLMLADDPEEPKWDESNPRAARYLKAWKDRRGK